MLTLKQIIETDLVFEREGRWFFWNESWSNPQGPFTNEWDARRGLVDYMKILLAKGDNDGEDQNRSQI